MSPSRSPLYLLSLLTALLLLMAAFSVVVSAGGQPGDPYGSPLDDGELTAPGADSEEPADAAALRVEIELVPRAGILPPGARGVPLLPDWTGEQEVLARSRSQALIRCRPVPGGPEMLRVARVGADGEYRLHCTGPGRIEGRVADSEGTPLAGAQVASGLLGGDGGLVWQDCDPDGAFVLELPSAGSGVPLLARAPGHATRWLECDGGTGHRVDLRLDPAARLRVQLAATVVDPSAGRVLLLPGLEERGRFLDYPFFLAALGAGWWLDGQGTFSLRDLPRGVSLQAQVQHPELLAPRPRSVTPRGGKTAIAILRGETAPRRLVGTVLGADDLPLAGAALQFQTDAFGENTYELGDALLPTELETGVLHRGRSDAEGRFELPIPAGAGRLELRAAHHCGLLHRVVAGRQQPGERVFRLPPADAYGEPQLILEGIAEGRPVHVRAGRGPWLSFAPGEPCIVPLAERALLDARIRVQSGGDPERQLHRSGVAVAGPFSLRVAGESGR